MVSVSTSGIACLVAVQPSQAAEPAYQGKALSEWLLALHTNLSDDEMAAATRLNVDPAKLGEQKQSRAQDAIRQIGTNGLPTLLDIIRVEQWTGEKCSASQKQGFSESCRERNSAPEKFLEVWQWTGLGF